MAKILCVPAISDIDDVVGSNGRLLWGNGTGDDLVIDESYEYARPNAEEEEEEELLKAIREHEQYENTKEG